MRTIHISKRFEPKCIIYLIINNLTGQCYVGQTWDSVERRWRAHCKGPRKGVSYIHRAIMLYGQENFSRIVLAEAFTQEDADFCECYLIDHYHSMYNENGYNIRRGGSHGKLADVTKQKLAIKATGRKASEETKKKLSDMRVGDKNPMYGKTHSEETIALQTAKRKLHSGPNKGKSPSQETRDKQSAKMTGSVAWNKGIEYVAIMGENNTNAKLKKEDILTIRGDNRENTCIAKDYNVSPSTIGRIKLRQTWGHI